MKRELSAEKRFFRIVLLTSLGTVVFMLFVSLVTFFLTIRGQEQTMVPDVEGIELVDALMDLQSRELYPRVQVRFSANPEDKGRVLSQDPNPGTVVKAGRRIELVVSKGTVVQQVDNYIGQNIEDVRASLQTLFASYKPLLKIKEPVVYVNDEAPRGTILEQKPEPFTEISGLTELEFVVSKGPEPEMFTLQDYRGIPFDQAMLMLAEKDIPFLVEVGEVEEDEDVQDGIVLKQEPPRGTGLEQGEAVELTISKPEDLADNEVFGILEYELPDYPILVDLSYSVISDTGERREVFTMKHPGGTISIPYIEKIGSLLTISIFDREIIQRTVRPKSTESEANQPASNPEQPESVLPESE